MELNVEEVVQLDKFKVRWYQKEIWNDIMNAIEGKPGPRSFLICAPRRMGKDLTVWNLCLRKALSERCTIMYYLPTQALARRVIWDSITNDGINFLEYIPLKLVESFNISLMRITLINGSIICLQGAQDFGKASVGVNPKMIVFSEFSKYNSDEAFIYASPILAANNGILVIISTPFGKNHMWHLHQIAKTLKNWKTYHYKTSEIKHVSEEALEEQRRILTDQMYMQEWECSYEQGVDGSIYGKEIERIRQNGQICTLMYHPELVVHTVFDIGVNDATCILFFQVVGDGQIVRIIDSYTSTDIGLPSYIAYLKSKPYNYGTHFLPIDGKVREWGSDGKSRMAIAEDLGIQFHILEQEKRLADGIENAKVMFNRMWIDQDKCKGFLEALENYRRVWNEERRMYEGILKNHTNHYADAFRYLCRAVPLINTGLSSTALYEARQEVMYGRSSRLPQLLDPDFNPRY